MVHTADILSSCEAMIFDTDGLPLQGITGGYGTERRVEFIIKDPSYAQTYYIEVSANGEHLLSLLGLVF